MTTTSPFGESVPVQVLADGGVIPTLALGVWQSVVKPINLAARALDE